MENEHFTNTDFAEVAHLLNIVEKCAGHSGKLANISGAAMEELLKLNEHIRAGAAEKKKADQEKAAEEAAADVTKTKKEPEMPTALPRRDFSKETSNV